MTLVQSLPGPNFLLFDSVFSLSNPPPPPPFPVCCFAKAPFIQVQFADPATVFGKSKLQVPDTETSQYCWILEHFWCTSIAWKCDIYVL